MSLLSETLPVALAVAGAVVVAFLFARSLLQLMFHGMRRMASGSLDAAVD